MLEVLRAFDAERVRYVLIGGVAINLHGLARATKDVDLFLSPEPENVERAKRALRAVFQDPEIDAISAEDLSGDYPVIRYGPPNDPFVIDLISRFGEAFRFADLEAEDRVIDGVRVRLATPRTLYRLKKDTVRPVDRADAAALKRRFSLEDG